MGRKALPPRGVQPVSLAYAARQYLLMVRRRSGAESGTPRARAVVLNHLVAYLTGTTYPAGVQHVANPEREVWTIARTDFHEALTYIVAGADAAEAAYRRAHGMKPRTGRRTTASQDQARATIWQFADYCQEKGWLPADAMPRKNMGWRPKQKTVERVEYPTVAESDWPEVLQRAGEVHARCRMAVAFGLYTSKRVSEYTRVQLRHINFDARTIMFWTQKAGKHELFPLYDALMDEVKLFLDWAVENHGDPHPDWYMVPSRVRAEYMRGSGIYVRVRQNPRLFPVDMFARSSTETVNLDVRKVLATFGVGPNEGTGTHTWRRSAANVADERHGRQFAQAMLGHARPETTAAYLRKPDTYLLLREKLMAGTGYEPQQRGNVVPLRRGRDNAS